MSRRQFMKYATAGLVTATAPELVASGHSWVVAQDRRLRPELLEQVPDSSVAWGLSPDSNSLQFALQTGRALGLKPHLINFFTSSNQPFKQQPRLLLESQRTLEAGCLPVLSHGMRWRDVNFAALVDDLQQLEGEFIFRPYFEMNSSWAKGWYGDYTPQEFVAHWRELRVHLAFNLPQARLIFSPNATIGAESFTAYFPGTEYVDLLGLDCYNKYSFNRLSPRHYLYPQLSAEALLGPDLARLQQLAAGKPIVLTEINASLEKGRADWLQSALSYAVRAGVSAWMTFDCNKAGAAWDEIDWAVLHDHQLLETLRGELKQAYYLPKLEKPTEILSALEQNL